MAATGESALMDALAKHASGASLDSYPARAIEAAKRGLIDCIGCALAGSREPVAEILCRFVEREGGARAATLIGRGLRVPAPAAALVNGAAAHSIGYDDITHAIRGHPSVVIVPAVLALGEEEGASGAEALTAYIAGFETGCRVGAAMSSAYFDELGWHPTAPLGAISAAAASARLLRLDARRTATALSVAASQAAGLRQNFGTMTKFFHAGSAARAGVTAARLAQAGFTASASGIEGPAGFIHAFSGGRGYDLAKAGEGFGRGLHLADHGIQIKKYPCCGETHLALDALFLLLRRERVATDAIAEVTVVTDFDPPRSLIYPDPENGAEAKFSMQYCIAAALVDRRIVLSSFEDPAVKRAEVRALMPRVRMIRTPGFEGTPSHTEAKNTVRVRMTGDRIIEQVLARPAHGVDGIEAGELEAKFADCASRALEPSETRELFELLGRIERLERLDRVTALLASRSRSAAR